MKKIKKPFEVSRIRKMKKMPEPGLLRRIKQWIHRYDHLFRNAALLLLVALATLIVYHYQQSGGYLFKASVLEPPLPFTGTVYPVDKVPDWTNWPGSNHTTHYTTISSNLLLPLPAYDLQKLQFPTESLVWGNAYHNEIRNAKITYSVVYMGNYQMDHTEYSGSHPAVDIRLPVGTPIKSIANGRVVKKSMIKSGYGHHVVIQHRNVPDLDNPQKKVTLYSAYSHMDEIVVTEGQTVTKGQLIGTSGKTGTATTPHLHFQIDRDSAPWHPFWPFTAAESQSAGLSFFEAVNAALGQSNAKKHTVNPMLYISKYLNHDGASFNSGSDDSAGSDNPPPNNDPQETPPPQVEVPVITTPPSDQSGKIDTNLFTFSISGESVSMTNNGVTLIVTDKNGQLEKMSDTDEVRVTLTGVGRVSKKAFRKVDFQNNTIQFIVNSSETGTANIMVGKSTHKIGYIDQVKPISSLAIETDGGFQKGQVKIIRVVAIDEDGTPTPVVNFSGTIEMKAKQGSATFTPDRLAVNHFKNGVAEVRMISQATGSIIVRAQNGALVGESKTIYPEERQLFSDVSRTHANYQAIKYLTEQRVVDGYDDGTFKPGNTVNRVEALKMLMLAFGVEAGPAGQLPFKDTEDAAWYATTLATALEKTIVQGYNDGTFRPSSTVNKAEYLKMLFLTGGISPTDTIAANPYNDVPKDAWYAPYAYLTNRMNLLEVANNRLSAGSGMTRGEVAETIYRLKYIQDHNLLAYSR